MENAMLVFKLWSTECAKAPKSSATGRLFNAPQSFTQKQIYC